MPSPVELDLNHWVHVVPAEGRTQSVKCLSFACLYANGAAPPELASEGTELSATSTLALEGGRWFIAKKASSTELQKPSILEVLPATVESIGAGELAEGSVTAAKIASEAVTEAKIASTAVAAGKIATSAVESGKVKNLAVTEGKLAAEAVGAAKALPATLPAAGAEKSVVLGTAGVQRKMTAVHVGDGAETKVKVKHGFESEAVNVIAQKGAETKKPGANYLNAAGAGNYTWAPISLSEVEVTFGTAPIAKFESFLSVFA